MTIFFYKGWPKIRKSEIPPSEFWPISGDCGKLGMPNLLIPKCYWIMQNFRVAAFAISGLLSEKQHGGWRRVKLPSSRSQIRVSLSREHTLSLYQRIMWVFGWVPLTASQQTVIFGDHRSCRRQDISHVTLHDHVIRG